MRLVLACVLFVALAACGTPALSDQAANGRELVLSLGCTECHSAEGGLGPSWNGTWGTLRPLVGGSTVLFDAEYVRKSILEPREQIVQGFGPQMPIFSLSDDDLDAIIAYLEEST